MRPFFSWSYMIVSEAGANFIPRNLHEAKAYFTILGNWKLLT